MKRPLTLDLFALVLLSSTDLSARLNSDCVVSMGVLGSEQSWVGHAEMALPAVDEFVRLFVQEIKTHQLRDEQLTLLMQNPLEGRIVDLRSHQLPLAQLVGLVQKHMKASSEANRIQFVASLRSALNEYFRGRLEGVSGAGQLISRKSEVVRRKYLQLNQGVSSFDLSPDGTELLVGTASGSILKYAVSARGLVYQAEVARHDSEVVSLVYHPSGRIFSSTTRKGEGCFRSARPGHAFSVLNSWRAEASVMAGGFFSADGKKYYMRAKSGKWGVQYLRREAPDILMCTPIQSAPYGSLEPSQNLLAISATCTVLVWDTNLNVNVWKDDRISDVAVSLDLSPDSRWLAVAYRVSSSMIIYDIASQKPIHELPVRVHLLSKVRFSRDGQYLIASSLNGSLEFHALPDEMWAR